MSLHLDATRPRARLALLTSRRPRGPFRLALRVGLGGALLLVGALAMPAAAAAEGSPDITVSVGSPAQVLYGSKATVTLTAQNPAGQPYGYNLSYRAVLPKGVSFVNGSSQLGSGGAAPTPTVIANEPESGQTTVVWSNVGDLSPNSKSSLSFEVTPSTVEYTIGSSFKVEAGAYLASEPRYLPKFSASTGKPEGPEAHSYTGYATGSATSTVTAIEVSQSASAGAILRGVHKHQVVYKLTVTNNSVKETTAVKLNDYLPAALEYLGCGGAGSDHTTDAPTNLGSAEEYPGSGPIEVEALGGCTAPELVETEEAEPDAGGGDPHGVYTHLRWSLGTLAAGQSRTFEYRAAVPLRENTMTWLGSKPSGASGHQAANLNNNSGAETRDGESIVTFAETGGLFEGKTAVSANGTLTRVARDITAEKSASTNVLADGQITKWTIVLHSSEYRYNTAITVTDTLPSGLCPLSSTNLTSSSECEPVAGDEPSSPYASAVEEANGTWTLVWNESVDAALANVKQNASATISFYSRTRSDYQEHHAASTPILANDTVTNDVLADATTNVVCADDTDCSEGPTERINHERPLSEPLSASASASQTAEGPTITKKIASSGTECGADSYVTSTPVYHPGDLICWLVEVAFPTTIDTHGSVVTDFLPGSVIFDEAFNTGKGEEATAGDTLPGTSFGHSEAGHGELGGAITWTLPESGYVGSSSQRLERVFATEARLPEGAAPGDLQGNLMKFASIDTAGQSFALRSEANYKLQFPDLSLEKQVVALNGGAITPAKSATVKGSTEVEFALTLTNSGELAATDAEVWDDLPSGLTCADFVSATDGGTCSSINDRITWGETELGSPQPAVEVPASGQTVLHYVIKVPATIDPGTTLENTSGIRRYTSATNHGSTYTYKPAHNIDPAVAESEWNVPEASSVAKLVTESAKLEKTHTSAITETDNSAEQATIGEQVTFEVKATIPAGTTLSGTPEISDPTIPSPRMTFESGSIHAFVQEGEGAATEAPGTFKKEEVGGSPVLVLPEDYAAPAGKNVYVTMRFNVHIANVSENNAAGSATEKSVPNDGKLAWTNPLSGQHEATSENKVPLVEPSITLTQSNNASGGKVKGGQLVEYKLTLKNAATASTAFTNQIVDTVPEGLIPSKSGGSPLANGEETESGGVWNEPARTITWTKEKTASLAKILKSESPSVVFFAKVAESPVASSKLTNKATATTWSLEGESALARNATNAPTASIKGHYDSSTEASIEVEGATLKKESDSATATIGHRVMYTLTVTLPAHVVAYDETVIDTLPDSLDFDEYVKSECTSGCPPDVEVHTYKPEITAGSTRVAWYLGNLNNTESPRTVKLYYRASVRPTHRNGGAKIEKGAEIKNAAVLYYNQTEKGSFVESTIPSSTAFDKHGETQTTTTTVIEPSLTLVKESAVDGGAFSTSHKTVTDGDRLEYKLSVKNTGNAPAYDVVVTDKPPSALVAPVTAGEGSADVTKNVAGEIAWKVPGPVAAGETVTLGYKASLREAKDLERGETVDNEAKVPAYFGVAEAERLEGLENYAGEPISYREYAGPSAQVTASVELPAISIEKTTGVGGFPSTAQAEVGQRFPWRVVVRNTSSVTATHVRVSDQLPANWEYVAGSASFSGGTGSGAFAPSESGALASGIELLWETPIELGPGESTTLTYEAEPTLAAETDPGSGASNLNRNSASATVEDKQGSSEDAAGKFAAGPASANGELAVPALRVTKTPTKASVQAGEGDAYEILVENRGEGTAREVIADDTFPAGMTYTPGSATASPSSGFSELSATSASAEWKIASIAPGETVEITVPIETEPTLESGTKLVNEVAVHAAEAPTPISATGTIEVTTGADLEASKSIIAGGEAVPGEEMTYEIKATNNGPSLAHGVKLEDDIPAAVEYVKTEHESAGLSCEESAGTLTCSAATLEVGKSVSAQVVVAIPASATGTIKNSVAVTSETPDPEPANNEASVEAETHAKAVLKLEKTALQPEVLDGQDATFKLVATDEGPSDAAGAKIVDMLPHDLTYVSATGASCSAVAHLGEQEVTCELGTLAAGANDTVEIVVATSGVATYTNHAQVHSEAEDPEPAGSEAEASVNVLAAAQLKLVKEVSPTYVELPGEVTYTLKLENEGPDAAQGVVVHDPLPEGLTYVSASSGCSAAGQTVTCEVGELESGASDTITLTARVAVTLGEETVMNTAEATSTTGMPDPALAKDSVALTTGPAADVAIVKSGPASVVSGSQIEWSLAVSNNGPSSAHKVAVSDPLPAGTTYVSSSSTQGTCQYAAGTLTCELGTLADGESATIGVRAIVDAGPGVIKNTASVEAEEPDPEPKNNESSAETTVVPAPVVPTPTPVVPPNPSSGVKPEGSTASVRTRVTLRKLVDRAVATPGSRLKYRLIVRNTGAHTAQNVLACDLLPRQTTVVSRGGGQLNGGRICFRISSLAAGARRVLKLVLRVDSNARGRVVNHATVTGSNFATVRAHVATRIRGAVRPYRERSVTG